MIFIILSALSSIAVAILLKEARLRAIDTWQLIMWNYAAALALSVTLLLPDLSQLNTAQLPWGWLSLLAVMLPSVFLIYSRALQIAGVIATEMAQRLSLLIALCAAFWIFGDTTTPSKLIGIALGFIAMVTLIARRRDASGNAQSGSLSAGLVLLLVWVGYGAIDITLKQIAASGVPFSLGLTIGFSGAALLMMALLGVRASIGRAPQPHSRLLHLGLGLLLGILNFANIAFYLQAHRHFAEQPALVFAGMNLLVVALGVLAGHLRYKEPLTRLTWAALALTLLAIALLTQDQWR